MKGMSEHLLLTMRLNFQSLCLVCSNFRVTVLSLPDEFQAVVPDVLAVRCRSRCSVFNCTHACFLITIYLRVKWHVWLIVVNISSFHSQERLAEKRKRAPVSSYQTVSSTSTVDCMALFGLVLAHSLTNFHRIANCRVCERSLSSCAPQCPPPRLRCDR